MHWQCVSADKTIDHEQYGSGWGNLCRVAVDVGLWWELGLLIDQVDISGYVVLVCEYLWVVWGCDRVLVM